MEKFAHKLLVDWRYVEAALEVYDSINRKPQKADLTSLGRDFLRQGNLDSALIAYEASGDKPTEMALVECGEKCLSIGQAKSGLAAFKLAKQKPAKELLLRGANYLIKGGLGISDGHYDDAMALFKLAGQRPPSDELRTFTRRALESGNLELGIRGYRRLGEPIPIGFLIRIADAATAGNNHMLAMKFYEAAVRFERSAPSARSNSA